MNNNEYVKHGGIRGMRWGYHDGRRNGKRTARAKKYENIKNLAMQGTVGYIQDSEKAKTKDEKRYYDKKADISAKNAFSFRDAEQDASGLGYQIGYNLGQTTRKISKQAPKVAKDFKHSISRGTKEVSKAANKTYKSITKNASSGLSWLKKHIF